MSFDLREIPFSRYGSYLCFRQYEGHHSTPDGFYLRAIHGDSNPAEALQLELLVGGKPAAFSTQGEPHCLRIEADKGEGFVEIVMPEPDVVRIRGRGAGLRLTNPCHSDFDNAIRRYEDRWQLNLYAAKTKLMLTSLDGAMVVDAPWEPKRSKHIVIDLLPEGSEKRFEAAIEEFRPEWNYRDYPMSFDKCLRQVDAEFRDWLKKTPRTPRSYSRTRELAAYLNWSSVAGARGHLTRPGMLMSKRHMTHLWSWDHCFNAIALSYHNFPAAWDQMMVVFDNQDPSGCLPDALNDRIPRWQYVKPPIHGWALRQIMNNAEEITSAHLREIYEPLSRWTNWWVNSRDDDGSGLPAYFHGNDSGWDNATIFDDGGPIEGPDLAAFLVLQMEVLADVAERIGRRREQKLWQMRAYEMLESLMETLWDGERFLAPRKFDGHVVEQGDCLLNFMPIILGELLPKDVRRKLISGLRQSGRFFTKHGMATESPKSPKYQSDGYWRGPIWAPSTMLLVDGLARSGQKGLAGEIARRFCKMCQAEGFAENFDAETGKGLRDLAYTWTSSVFLVLAHDYLLKK
ncbi:MAG: amylo-alpha-1,6-glucosidase [Phycisphaerae bacterium]